MGSTEEIIASRNALAAYRVLKVSSERSVSLSECFWALTADQYSDTCDSLQALARASHSSVDGVVLDSAITSVQAEMKRLLSGWVSHCQPSRSRRTLTYAFARPSTRPKCSPGSSSKCAEYSASSSHS